MKAVLTFHSIDDSGSVLSYPPDLFELVIAALGDLRVPVMRLEDLMVADHGVAITFDDGMLSVSQNALPIIVNASVPVHLFLTTGFVGKDNKWPSQPAGATRFEMMKWRDLERCIRGGVVLENHTHSHPYLTKCSPQQIADEVDQADEIIERATGRRPIAFAYPYGAFNEAVVAAIKPLYRFGLTTRLDYISGAIDPHLIPRLDSYYFRQPWLATRLSTRSMEGYISIRAFLRQLKGST